MGSGPDLDRRADPSPLRPVRKFEYRYEASRPGLWARLRRAVRRIYRNVLGAALLVLFTFLSTLAVFGYASLVRRSAGEAAIGVIREEYARRGLDLEPIPDEWRERKRAEREGRR